MHCPKSLIGGGFGGFGDANVEEASAGMELLENGEGLGDGKVGLDRGDCPADGTES